jgi:hypothetical protein
MASPDRSGAALSESARQKIEAAGGTAEIVEWYANPQSES